MIKDGPPLLDEIWSFALCMICQGGVVNTTRVKSFDSNVFLSALVWCGSGLSEQPSRIITTRPAAAAINVALSRSDFRPLGSSVIVDNRTSDFSLGSRVQSAAGWVT